MIKKKKIIKKEQHKSPTNPPKKTTKQNKTRTDLKNKQIKPALFSSLSYSLLLNRDECHWQ